VGRTQVPSHGFPRIGIHAQQEHLREKDKQIEKLEQKVEALPLPGAFALYS
jgi:hypothetical protein